jgi:hypothetical protein
MVLAIIFAFLSLTVIRGWPIVWTNSLSTNTIILIGVIFSMLSPAL